MLKIFNTATKNKEIFHKKIGEEVKIYSCGLTVYDYASIGNLRTYTNTDIITRTLKFLGYNVKLVQNFTDVGHETFTDEQKAKIKTELEINDTDKGIDRIEKAAKRTGMSVWEVVEFYIVEAKKDFTEMNFLEPHRRPRATEFIPQQIELIKLLLEKDLAYITPSAIYYDTTKFFEYGALTGQSINDKIVGFRAEVEVDPNKKNPADFRLWQLDEPNHVMQWDFEYQGKILKGYPGWHIECSAMAHEILGHPIDIHTGGEDLIPVHHTNEIAQSEGAFGKPFSHLWLHTAFLKVDGRKMSKSLGNAYTLRDIKEKGFDPMDLRYFYLTADFRKPQNFTWEALDAAKNARVKLKSYIETTQIALNSRNEEIKQTDDIKNINWYTKFSESLEDSFNMPQSIAVVWEMLNSDSLHTEILKLQLLEKFDEVLGLKLFERPLISIEAQMEIERIISKRDLAKKNKDYTEADKFREQVKKLGFELIDTAEGTKYNRI